MAVADWPIAQRQAAQVYRQNTAAIQRGGQGKNQNAAAHGQQRVQAFGQFNVVDQPQQQPAAAKAKDDPHAKLLQQVKGEHPAQRGFAGGDHRNQSDGEEDRHRIVAAGFNFQRSANPFVKPFTAQQ
ncbi:hypothetical protein D3C80_1530590 [compost metagenome]